MQSAALLFCLAAAATALNCSTTFVVPLNETNYNDGWARLTPSAAYQNASFMCCDCGRPLCMSPLSTSAVPSVAALEFRLPRHNFTGGAGYLWLYTITYAAAQLALYGRNQGGLGAWHAFAMDWGASGSSPNASAIRIASGSNATSSTPMSPSGAALLLDGGDLCETSIASARCRPFAWPVNAPPELDNTRRNITIAFAYNGTHLYPQSVASEYGLGAVGASSILIASPSPWIAPSRVILVARRTALVVDRISITVTESTCAMSTSTTAQQTTSTTTTATIAAPTTSAASTQTTLVQVTLPTMTTNTVQSVQSTDTPLSLITSVTTPPTKIINSSFVETTAATPAEMPLPAMTSTSGALSESLTTQPALPVGSLQPLETSDRLDATTAAAIAVGVAAAAFIVCALVTAGVRRSPRCATTYANLPPAAQMLCWPCGASHAKNVEAPVPEVIYGKVELPEELYDKVPPLAPVVYGMLKPSPIYDSPTSTLAV